MDEALRRLIDDLAASRYPLPPELVAKLQREAAAVNNDAVAFLPRLAALLAEEPALQAIFRRRAVVRRLSAIALELGYAYDPAAGTWRRSPDVPA